MERFWTTVPADADVAKAKEMVNTPERHKTWEEVVDDAKAQVRLSGNAVVILEAVDFVPVPEPQVISLTRRRRGKGIRLGARTESNIAALTGVEGKPSEVIMAALSKAGFTGSGIPKPRKPRKARSSAVDHDSGMDAAVDARVVTIMRSEGKARVVLGDPDGTVGLHRVSPKPVTITRSENQDMVGFADSVRYDCSACPNPFIGNETPPTQCLRGHVAGEAVAS